MSSLLSGVRIGDAQTGEDPPFARLHLLGLGPGEVIVPKKL